MCNLTNPKHSNGKRTIAIEFLFAQKAICIYVYTEAAMHWKTYALHKHTRAQAVLELPWILFVIRLLYAMQTCVKRRNALAGILSIRFDVIALIRCENVPEVRDIGCSKHIEP